MFKNKATCQLVQHIIIDTDGRVDDIIALLLFLNAEKEGLVKIEAICCTRNANTTVENVCKNVIRILQLIRRTDVSCVILLSIFFSRNISSREILNPHDILN